MNKMKKLYKVEDMVREILEVSEECREDDFLLIKEVYRKIDPNIVEMSFYDVMENHKSLRLPYFETIRRTRQKLQADNEDLRPSQEVQDARLNETAEYINYAIDGYGQTFIKFVENQD